nr:hypothetical protein [Spirosoma sp. KCTC 42546]
MLPSSSITNRAAWHRDGEPLEVSDKIPDWMLRFETKTSNPVSS